jgi:hypothetical protein
MDCEGKYISCQTEGESQRIGATLNETAKEKSHLTNDEHSQSTKVYLLAWGNLFFCSRLHLCVDE